MFGRRDPPVGGSFVIIKGMVISVSQLSKNYITYKKESGFIGSIKSLINRRSETVLAVDKISFDISEGELVGFIGPNGAGKTTTLKCLSGLLYPTGGKISVLGYDPYLRKKDFLKQISLVMGQKNQLWWDLPAEDSFLLQKEIYEVSDSQYKKNLSSLVDLLDVGKLLEVPIKKLSLGQRMKMELIGALIYSPKVLFLDEPTIGLDVVMQQNLRDFIKNYNKDFNSTIILTSHYMQDVEELCKRVIIINHGKILYDGLLSDLVKKHSPEKVIKVTLNKPIDDKSLKSLSLGKVESGFPLLIIRVDRKKIGEITSKVLDNLDVEDLNIQDPEIEEVIRAIFKTA